MSFKMLAKLFTNIWFGVKKNLQNSFARFLNVIHDTPLKVDTVFVLLSMLCLAFMVCHVLNSKK